MNRLSALLSALFLSMFFLASCTSDPEQKTPEHTTVAVDTLPATPAHPSPSDTAHAILSDIQNTNVENGKALYEANCLRCHGPGGKSVMQGVPNLAEGGCPKRELRGMIHSGRGLMPSFKDQLTSQEIGQLVNYVLYLREQNHTAQ